MPRADLRVFHGTHSPDSVSYVWMFNLGVGHHSNGQTECMLRDSRRVGIDRECVPASHYSTEQINGLNGDFSTNYVRMGVAFQFLRSVRGESFWWRFGAESDRHAEFLGMMTPEMRSFYRPKRFRLKLDITDASGENFGVRLSSVWERAWGLDEVERIDSIMVDGYVYLLSLDGWGLFVRVYQGEDYYNVAFLNERVKWIQLGIAWRISERGDR